MLCCSWLCTRANQRSASVSRTRRHSAGGGQHTRWLTHTPVSGHSLRRGGRSRTRLEEDFQGDQVLAALLPRQVHVPELAPPQWLAHFKVSQRPALVGALGGRGRGCRGKRTCGRLGRPPSCPCLRLPPPLGRQAAARPVLEVAGTQGRAGHAAGALQAPHGRSGVLLPLGGEHVPIHAVSGRPGGCAARAHAGPLPGRGQRTGTHHEARDTGSAEKRQVWLIW